MGPCGRYMSNPMARACQKANPVLEGDVGEARHLLSSFMLTSVSEGNLTDRMKGTKPHLASQAAYCAEGHKKPWVASPGHNIARWEVIDKEKQRPACIPPRQGMVSACPQRAQPLAHRQLWSE